jgi:hypothetical protein
LTRAPAIESETADKGRFLGTARMQGKSCFNFKKIDKGLFAELAKLTDAGYKRFERDGWV